VLTLADAFMADQSTNVSRCHSGAALTPGPSAKPRDVATACGSGQ